MVQHFSNKYPCAGSFNRIELTDEIKKDILLNRVYINHLRIQDKNLNKLEQCHNDDNNFIPRTARQYVYVVQEREFIALGMPIYKIGYTTKKPLIRLSRYPKGSECIFITPVSNGMTAEQQIFKEFEKHEELIQRKDIGTEYYEGDLNKMISIIKTQT